MSRCARGSDQEAGRSRYGCGSDRGPLTRMASSRRFRMEISRSTWRPVRCATDPASGRAGPEQVTPVLVVDSNYSPTSTVEPLAVRARGLSD